MKEEIRANVKSILELIEDKRHPAKRVLFDYVSDLVKSFDYETGKEIEQMGIAYFKEKDKL